MATSYLISHVCHQGSPVLEIVTGRMDLGRADATLLTWSSSRTITQLQPASFLYKRSARDLSVNLVTMSASRIGPFFNELCCADLHFLLFNSIIAGTSASHVYITSVILSLILRDQRKLCSNKIGTSMHVGTCK
ncbi:hypothetical protein R1flu_028326 [Riccia fluitans]|uniref:Uncharacterized protein n=1 Tax=Riccia fluitans TaxID=41844 RepID=A0ABD1XM01_9MARC